jgi:hypothetical protein
VNINQLAVPAITPYIAASIRKGPLMNLRLAPISLIISISSFLLKIAILMVLTTTKIEMPESSAAATTPTFLTVLYQLEMVFKLSC